MAKEKPDHHDAELVIKLYDLRRESVLRASRDAITARFFPKDYDEFLAVTQPSHPHNAAFRQVSTYWEMVYGMAHHEIAHAEYLIENSGEGLILYTKVAPYLQRFREEVSPHAFKHAEWAATQTATGRRYHELFQKRLKTMAANAATQAAAGAAAGTTAGAATGATGGSGAGAAAGTAAGSRAGTGGR